MNATASPLLQPLCDSLTTIARVTDARALRAHLEGRGLPIVGGDTEPAELILRALGETQDPPQLATDLALPLAQVIAECMAELRAEEVKPILRLLLQQALRLAADLPANVVLASSLRDLATSLEDAAPDFWHQAPLAPLLARALVYQQTDSQTEPLWLRLLETSGEGPWTPERRTVLLSAWRGLLHIPPDAEAERTGRVIDMDRFERGLIALAAGVRSRDSGSRLVRQALRVLAETFPRSPQFWRERLESRFDRWPEGLREETTRQWPLAERGTILAVDHEKAKNRRPGPNWLCIDFGASAIAAAVSNARNDSVQLVSLQEVSIRKDGRAYGQEYDGNPEAGTPFLPSWVACNADLRQEVPAQDDGWRPGSPHFRPASLQPGDSSFLSLPASLSQLNDIPGRVIFSLKGWLGKSVREIRLQDRVKFLRQGHEVEDRILPLDAVVESGFAALAEGYLYNQKVDQIVICHPNTFTSYHRQRLHNIASRALMRVFGINSPRHIHLISESDAVAYYYCNQRLRGEPREKRERILVYDFGGGTLDLSVLSIDWNRDPFYPKGWTLEARTGVPIAGNYLDELLARMVDDLLRDSEVMCRGDLEYAFPVVAELPEPFTELHRTGILRLHQDLKRAKHAWDGNSPFVLRVGGTKGGWGVLRVARHDLNMPDALADPAQPGIFEQDGFLYLSIPAWRVHRDTRLAEYLDFVTETVTSETLLSAGLRPDKIDTLIVSGRGALWPGLRERLAAFLPNAFIPDMGSGVAMKEVVARGAISRQELLNDTAETPAGGRLGVLLANGTRLVPEEEWGSPIDLSSSSSFRLVQVGLSKPDPLRDVHSLRRHFYIDLSSQIYLRETLWRDDPRLFIEKVQRDGKEVIVLRNSQGQELIWHDLAAGVFIPTVPPWPIGEVLLRPER